MESEPRQDRAQGVEPYRVDTEPKKSMGAAGFLIPLVVLIVLAVGGELGARALVNSKTAEQVQAAQGVTLTDAQTTTHAEITTPMIKQLIDGKLERVEVTAPAATFAQGPVSVDVQDVELVTHGLVYETRFAERVDAKATIPFTQVSDLLPGPLPGIEVTGGSGSGLDVSTALGGVPITARLVVEPVRSEGEKVGALRISFDDVEFEQTGLLAQLMDALLGELEPREVPVPPLPYGLYLTDMETTDAGFRISTSGEGVQLPRGSSGG